MIASVFLVVFTSFLVVPSIMAVVDDNYDISILITSSEEEENHSNYFELKPASKEANNLIIDFSLAQLSYGYSENYSSLFQELHSPPPEFLF